MAKTLTCRTCKRTLPVDGNFVHTGTCPHRYDDLCLACKADEDSAALKRELLERRLERQEERARKRAVKAREYVEKTRPKERERVRLAMRRLRERRRLEREIRRGG